MEIGKRKITKERSRGDRENERTRETAGSGDGSGDDDDCVTKLNRVGILGIGGDANTRANGALQYPKEMRSKRRRITLFEWLNVVATSSVRISLVEFMSMYVLYVCLFLSISLSLFVFILSNTILKHDERERESVCVCVYIESGRLLMRRHKK